MAGISASIGVSRSLGASQRSSTRNRSSELPLELQDRLTSFLNAQGVNAETQGAITKDLKSSLEKILGSGSPPDFKALQKTVSSVVQKYGLDGDKLAASLIAPPKLGRLPGGDSSPNTSSTAGTPSLKINDAARAQQQNTETLLDVLEQSSARGRGRDSQSIPTPPVAGQEKAAANASPYAQLENAAQSLNTANKISIAV